MPGLKDLANIWGTLKEVDLRPLRKAALSPVKLVIVGRPGVGRHTLSDQMGHDPQRPESVTPYIVLVSDLETEDWVSAAELIILMLDAASADFSPEQTLARKWIGAGKKVLAFINDKGYTDSPLMNADTLGWGMERVLQGSVHDPVFIQHVFVQAVLELLPERHLALGRQFPLFRVPIVHQLINETCLSNAAIAFSTGVAEVVPIFDIPLNITDTVVLIKTQAFLVYKLGLTLGLSTRWQDYVGEFGSVIGGGFVWRQLTRMLIGMIPIWGIIPKVTVAYAGTYVVGHVILQWYLTGRRITSPQMRTLYTQAFTNGKHAAQNMVSRLRRPGSRNAALLLPLNGKPCPTCGKPNAPDAHFCQYCGRSFQLALPG
jgi:uncharacterized protein (DUF697 family)